MLRVLEDKWTEKTKSHFTIHQDDKEKLRKVLSKLKSKWKESRTRKAFKKKMPVVKNFGYYSKRDGAKENSSRRLWYTIRAIKSTRSTLNYERPTICAKISARKSCPTLRKCRSCIYIEGHNYTVFYQSS